MAYFGLYPRIIDGWQEYPSRINHASLLLDVSPVKGFPAPKIAVGDATVESVHGVASKRQEEYAAVWAQTGLPRNVLPLSARLCPRAWRSSNPEEE